MVELILLVMIPLVVVAGVAWVTVASVRTIRRIGLRRYGVAVGRLGWDVSKVGVQFLVLVAGMAWAMVRSDDSEDNPCYYGVGFKKVGQTEAVLGKNDYEDEGNIL
ncbi:hypothetical protein CKO35_16290 [Ectothiorhodospira shaposhnikovii]|uniref:hypothetical protein n=1 Tax=Ectothiorhodospira shaposhnikovii TaxID=1054 RepID=UPI0019037B2B|nr:hypothetical protein [Ectothiorhodospira shaposhnikovii]MBK1674817.1 hypothetical protein [Ectothiorhodospira shaposhnikovii]